MALGAFAFLFAFLELTLVRIGPVATAAIGKGDLCLEISVHVTSRAGNWNVLPQKRIVCFGVIESKAGQQIFPTAGSVTGLAGFLEFALVRINVTRGAGVELHVLVANRTAGRFRLVAFFAGNFHV